MKAFTCGFSEPPVFEDLLTDEVSDEEDWENFLPSIKQKSVR